MRARPPCHQRQNVSRGVFFVKDANSSSFIKGLQKTDDILQRKNFILLSLKDGPGRVYSSLYIYTKNMSLYDKESRISAWRTYRPGSDGLKLTERFYWNPFEES